MYTVRVLSVCMGHAHSALVRTLGTVSCYCTPTVRRSALETDLMIEREWRATLQLNLEQEKQQTSKLQAEAQQLRDVKRVSAAQGRQVGECSSGTSSG